eukprot:4410745-Prymnesium_polylepis.1
MVFRYRVTESFLAAGVPLAVVDKLRTLLQRSGFSLTSSTNLKVFIPKIEQKEDDRIKAEIAGQFCTESFELVQRLLNFKTMEKHVNAVQLAAHISDVATRQSNIPTMYVVGLERDSVSVNGAACRRLM